MILLLLTLACGEAPAPTPQVGSPGSPGVAAPAPGSPGPAMAVQVDQQQQHPPIPAENPAWDWDAGGFVADAGWYGEHSWADVRMRVVGHLSVATRDLARLRAARGDLAGCAEAHEALLATLQATPAPPAGGIAAEVGALLQEASRREAALCGALARGEAPPVQGDGLYGRRTELLALLQRHALGQDVAAEARALQLALEPHLQPRPDLDLDAFRDFDDRHRLRVALFEAYLDSTDPLGISEPWGYWEPAELQRAALVLGLVAGRLGGEDWTGRAAPLLAGDPAAALGPDPRFWPSELAKALPRADAGADFTVEGLGWLPTGDTLIDVAAEPGPRAIGTLEKLGLDDPQHRAWLQAQEQRLDAALQADPGAIPPLVEELVAHVDAMGHGSRYYTIKQLRNEAVRQLARAGRPDLARTVLARSWPLHRQDWACPNRQGILLGLDGRLMLAAGQDGAEARLQEAVQAGLLFLDQVAAAERGEPVGVRPPTMGPGGPPGGPQGPPLPAGAPPAPRPR